MTATPKPLTEAEIAEIRTRVEVATPGPLVVERHDDDDGSIAYEVWTKYRGRRLWREDDDDSLGNPNVKADAVFAAHAHTDVPRLLHDHTSLVAQLDAATAREKVLREALEKYGDHRPECDPFVRDDDGSPCSCGYAAALR